MKTQSKDLISKANELYQVIQQRKALEKAESELKDFFKEKITDGVLDAGAVKILIQKRERTTLDAKALEKELGPKLEKFQRVTEYTQMTVEASA
jgi:hypothetical protein